MAPELVLITSLKKTHIKILDCIEAAEWCSFIDPLLGALLTYDLLCQDGEFGDDVEAQLERALTSSNIDTASASVLYEDYLIHARKYLQSPVRNGEYRFLTYKGLLLALHD